MGAFPPLFASFLARWIFVWLASWICWVPLVQASDIDWLAVGDLRGFIAPCGCDPHTDLGGIKRIATLLNREHMMHPAALVFHLGNAVSLQPQDRIKNQFIQKALAQFPLSAALYNVGELLHPDGLADLPYVLSNAKKKGVYQSQRRVGAYEIWGFSWSETIKADVETWDAFAAVYQHMWEKQESDIHRILLFSGPTSMLLQAAHAYPWSLIVSANAQPYGTVVSEDERKNPAQLIRMDYPFVRMVPLAGQGILRGGRLTLAEAPSLTGLLQQKTPGKSMPPSVLERAEITWLDPSYEGGSPGEVLFAEYVAAEAAFFTEEKERKKRDSVSSPFIGAEACKACHLHAYDVWKGSSHAKAYGTLQEKNKHQISECVSCHVVGFSQPGGFISAEDTPHLAGVQCENCHGPRQAHATAANPGLVKGGRSMACSTCHLQPHSPGFSHNAYWERVKH